MKPFSQACQNNRVPILKVLERVFQPVKHVLEVGSGTGQHAVYMARHLPELIWQTSDLVDNHAGIVQWMEEYPAENLRSPLVIDVATVDWGNLRFDGFFTANTLHIMAWPKVKKLFQGLGQCLDKGAVVAIYGPFNYQGKFTSESNERFETWLKAQDPERGIRDFADVNTLAEEAGLVFVEDNAMPANNRLLVWEKQS